MIQKHLSSPWRILMEYLQLDIWRKRRLNMLLHAILKVIPSLVIMICVFVMVGKIIVGLWMIAHMNLIQSIKCRCLSILMDLINGIIFQYWIMKSSLIIRNPLFYSLVLLINSKHPSKIDQTIINISILSFPTKQHISTIYNYNTQHTHDHTLLCFILRFF